MKEGQEVRFSILLDINNNEWSEERIGTIQEIDHHGWAQIRVGMKTFNAKLEWMKPTGRKNNFLYGQSMNHLKNIR